jgi:hypothetical protein
VEKVINKYESFEEAEEADALYYASLTPQQRVDILLEMIASYKDSLGDAGQKFERVYRVTDLASQEPSLPPGRHDDRDQR